jgi:uncharacterized protein
MTKFSRAATNVNTKSMDEGLRKYLLSVYNYMASALVVTGIAAYATMNFEPLTNLVFQFDSFGYFTGYTGFGKLLMWSPLFVALYFFYGRGEMSVQKSQKVLWLYAALTGISLSSLGFIYTGESIARTFFITSSVFGGMSLYGYTTKRDLTSMGSFLVMGVLGLIIASVVNMFMHSPAIHFVTSLLGVAIFMGMIAWDTQKMKSIYYSVGGGEMGQRMAVVGAFSLYLDFINLFLYLLRFFGDRRG